MVRKGDSEKRREMEVIYARCRSFLLKMVNALNDGINNCIQQTVGIDPEDTRTRHARRIPL